MGPAHCRFGLFNDGKIVSGRFGGGLEKGGKSETGREREREREDFPKKFIFSLRTLLLLIVPPYISYRKKSVFS